MPLTPFPADTGTARDVERGFHLPPEWLTDVRLIVDLGANIGLTMIDYAEKFPDALIVGAELDRANWEVAVQNLNLYPQATIYNIGIATWDGACAYDAPASNANNITGEGGSQECLTIDSFFDLTVPEGVVDFMKFDIEGMEREVLKAAAGARWLNRVRCFSVETHYGYEPAECLADIAALGFNTEIIKKEGPHAEHWIEVGYR